MIVPQILHDFRRPERYDPLIAELHSQGIMDYQLWEPVEDKNSVIRSINLSHKRIIKHAQKHNWPSVTIFEDDIQFTAPDAWAQFLADEPIWPYDLYLGGTYGLNKPITGQIDKINGFHCYICSSSFYDTFLSVPDDVHVDTAMDGLGRFYVRYPFIAIQRSGWSSNTRAFSDKNAMLSKEDIYHG